MNNKNLKPINERPNHKELCSKGGKNKKGSLSLVTILRKYLDNEIDFNDPIMNEKVRKRIGDVVVLKLISNAVKGDMRAIQEVLDRVDGKAKQEIDFKDTTEDPLMNESVPQLLKRMNKLLGITDDTKD